MPFEGITQRPLALQQHLEKHAASRHGASSLRWSTPQQGAFVRGQGIGDVALAPAKEKKKKQKWAPRRPKTCTNSTKILLAHLNDNRSVSFGESWWARKNGFLNRNVSF